MPRTAVARPGSARGPRPEARHWRALLPLILWSPELLHVDAVFDVERGREFGLHPNHVPTTLQIYEDHDGGYEEVEVRETGTFHVTQAQLPRLQAFCAAVTAKIDAVMDGATSSRRLPRRRALRLERAARHLLQAHQRTHSDYGVWEQEADELHLDYVIALEALMASPNHQYEGASAKGSGPVQPPCSSPRPCASRSRQSCRRRTARVPSTCTGTSSRTRTRARSWPPCVTSG
ncbi:hypothetical protein [Streptomyces purpurascens]|uniref:Uncharacterized protein n=1 Tax=Streptomyces purpurascens TaxID=1924 RepID=A0ABZ1MAA7_STREF